MTECLTLPIVGLMTVTIMICTSFFFGVLLGVWLMLKKIKKEYRKVLL